MFYDITDLVQEETPDIYITKYWRISGKSGQALMEVFSFAISFMKIKIMQCVMIHEKNETTILSLFESWKLCPGIK